MMRFFGVVSIDFQDAGDFAEPVVCKFYLSLVCEFRKLRRRTHEPLHASLQWLGDHLG